MIEVGRGSRGASEKASSAAVKGRPCPCAMLGDGAWQGRLANGHRPRAHFSPRPTAARPSRLWRAQGPASEGAHRPNRTRGHTDFVTAENQRQPTTKPVEFRDAPSKRLQGCHSPTPYSALPLAGVSHEYGHGRDWHLFTVIALIIRVETARESPGS